MRKNPEVTFKFKKFGEAKAVLYPQYAPQTCFNFISLIKRQYYDGLKVYNIVPNYMITMGCPFSRGVSGPGYGVFGEFLENGYEHNRLTHSSGALTMLHETLPNSAGSIFSILCGDIHSMDGKQAVFGEITEGLDVIKEMTLIGCDKKGLPMIKPVCESIRVETFGEEYPEPEHIPLGKVVSFFGKRR
ncbi:MAG: peptidylprolyl isomerase [Lachnospiraceae bacterium]|nr:peptidylprolyl isomerase [Lachnospiraceae bacterium]